MSKPLKKREEFWADVKDILEKSERNKRIVMLGDFNGWTGVQRDGYEKVLENLRVNIYGVKQRFRVRTFDVPRKRASEGHIMADTIMCAVLVLAHLISTSDGARHHDDASTNLTDDLRKRQPSMVTTEDVSTVRLTIKTDKRGTYQQIRTGLGIGVLKYWLTCLTVLTTLHHKIFIYFLRFKKNRDEWFTDAEEAVALCEKAV
ncbi:hypothetical protein EVAR_4224_1 [Eumeta japonica]|uniref:Craniofacial development protein 2 n=1 Tax=Eumeta variegata TaxID=151549 RepID=A0A4C1TH71_EUMVA|nr:hypothetical protein EVAR_4224_1 [Eumeta japonica]